MWLFILMYIVFLILEGVAAIIKIRRGKKDSLGTLFVTISGFSFIASAIGSDVCSIEDSTKIAFAYSVLYAIYWVTVQVFGLYYTKRNEQNDSEREKSLMKDKL